jgi:ATP-binding cassette, subfamily A (ABC1), member 3
VFLYFFLFFLATIALSFFIAAFFSKARSASTYGGLVFFMTVFPYFAIDGKTSSTGSLLAACILPR